MTSPIRRGRSRIESESDDLIKRQSSVKVKRLTSRQDSTKEGMGEISEKRLEKLVSQCCITCIDSCIFVNFSL